MKVWLSDQLVGSLLSASGKMLFAYDKHWLENPGSFPISLSLPLREEPFVEKELRPFFEGLLPEGRLRKFISRNLQLSQQNIFGLLKEIGGDCAGAITIGPQGFQENSTDKISWLKENELVSILKGLPQRPMLAGRQGLRLSLAGAQDKLPVVFDGQRIGLPEGQTPSTHILKTNIFGLEETVLNEHFCLSLANRVGIGAAHSQILQVGSEKVFLVERFDRIEESGQIKRLHQEDFCQALGFTSDNKYQADGGPGIKQCLELLRKIGEPPSKFLDYVILNSLIGNHDAHAKNFSLLKKGEKLELSPLYDALSTAIYEGLSSKMAMRIGKRYQDVGLRDWGVLAKDCNLEDVQKRLRKFAQILPKEAMRLKDQFEKDFGQSHVIDSIVELIGQKTFHLKNVKKADRLILS